MEKLVKICGLKTKANFEALNTMSPDMIGLNFYKPSSRYIDSNFDMNFLDSIPNVVKRVGVFVNTSLEEICDKADSFQLDFIQLHGSEKAQFAQNLVDMGHHVIKAFQISSSFDWVSLKSYEFCQFFLFDSRSEGYGGSGKKFNWDSIENYSGTTPFILSGGIGPEDLNALSEIAHPKFHGIDINSKFEMTPGDKNMLLANRFIQEFKNKSHA